MENWSPARERYETDAHRRDVPFEEAEHALKIVVASHTISRRRSSSFSLTSLVRW
jgi:hypothetical protein